jgi:hypothetical protein
MKKPKKAAARAVSYRKRCRYCGDPGDSRRMIYGETHTLCAAALFPLGQLINLPPNERGKITVDDLGAVSALRRNSIIEGAWPSQWKPKPARAPKHAKAVRK